MVPRGTHTGQPCVTDQIIHRRSKCSETLKFWLGCIIEEEGFNGELRAALTFKYPTRSKAALDDFTPIIY